MGFYKLQWALFGEINILQIIHGLFMYEVLLCKAITNVVAPSWTPLDF